MVSKLPDEQTGPFVPDEAYWTALFAQEEAISPSSSTPQPPDEPSYSNGFHTSPSRPLVRHDKAWEEAQALHKADQVIELQAVGFNKGGLLVNFHGLQGFVPASQLNDFPNLHLADERFEELRRRQYREMRLKLLEVTPAANRLIFSERAALVKADRRQALLQTLAPNDRLKGRVTNLAAFGAFVDLGGVEGLIHISELSWSRVEHPSEILHPDQEIEVLVLLVDAEEERIALSVKQLHRNPWKNVEERYKPGQLVQGIVSKIVHFGIFVQVEPELEGLVHNSEIDGRPPEVVERFDLGQRLVARVLEVNGRGRRLALSLREAA